MKHEDLAMVSENVDVVVLSPEQTRQMVLETLRWSGHSYAELEDMWRSGVFPSARSRHAWIVVAGLLSADDRFSS